MADLAQSPLAALLGTPGELPLDRAVALLAAEEQPGVDADAIVASLDALAASLRIPANVTPFEAVARLNHHLFIESGFVGEDADYYAPHNSFLDVVLERRRGLPILLAIVYIEVARRAGVQVDGVGFPGHFLVGVGGRDDVPRFFVDPFHGGNRLTMDGLRKRLKAMEVPREAWALALAPSDARQILLRMTTNLKGSYLRLRRLRDALRQVDRLLLLAPELVGEHRDRGLLLAEAGDLIAAEGALARYLELAPEAADVAAIDELLRQMVLSRGD